MTFEEFLEAQANVYASFEDTTKIEQEGLVPRIPEQQGGYSIALRHPARITEAVEAFSNRMAGQQGVRLCIHGSCDSERHKSHIADHTAIHPGNRNNLLLEGQVL